MIDEVATGEITQGLEQLDLPKMNSKAMLRRRAKDVNGGNNNDNDGDNGGDNTQGELNVDVISSDVDILARKFDNKNLM